MRDDLGFPARPDAYTPHWIPVCLALYCYYCCCNAKTFSKRCDALTSDPVPDVGVDTAMMSIPIAELRAPESVLLSMPKLGIASR